MQDENIRMPQAQKLKKNWDLPSERYPLYEELNRLDLRLRQVASQLGFETRIYLIERVEKESKEKR